MIDARSLRGVDWALLGYLAGLALWALADAAADVEGPEREPGAAMSESDGRHLSERQLSRLEDGQTVVVERWHGHALELAGSVVVDVGAEGGDR